MTKKVYPYTCPHCKDAPRRGQWRRSWRWKTERGFLDHKCYADEAPLPPSEKYHPDRENGEGPSWLTTGDPLLCPHCGGAFSYSAAQVPSLHFACPLCGDEVQWQRGGAREVAVLTRANPCRGKSVMRSVVESRDVCELVAFVSAEEFGDPRRVARLAAWERRERREGGAEAKGLTLSVNLV